jgi:hypothetical protein
MNELSHQYRDHQGTWEKLKTNLFKNFTVDMIIDNERNVEYIKTQAEFYDHEINYCVRKQQI